MLKDSNYPDEGSDLLHFKCLKKIGEGGWGRVYRAKNLENGRFEALKFLNENSLEYKDRFEYEISVQRRIKDLNGIVCIKEKHEYERWTFFSMQFIEGEEQGTAALPINKYVIEKKICIDNQLKLLTNLCLTVHNLHKRGLIHRDIKPPNVLVDHYEKPWLVDFGIAKFLDDGEATRSVETIKQPGRPHLGTIYYMAPEQTDQRFKLTCKTDVYAMGTLAYLILSNGYHPLFADDRSLSDSEMLSLIPQEDPHPLRKWNSEIQPELEKWVHGALEKSPEKRPSALELSDGLLNALEKSNTETIKVPVFQPGQRNSLNRARTSENVEKVREKQDEIKIGGGQKTVQNREGNTSHTSNEKGLAQNRSFPKKILYLSIITLVVSLCSFIVLPRNSAIDYWTSQPSTVFFDVEFPENFRETTGVSLENLVKNIAIENNIIPCKELGILLEELNRLYPEIKRHEEDFNANLRIREGNLIPPHFKLNLSARDTSSGPHIFYLNVEGTNVEKGNITKSTCEVFLDPNYAQKVKKDITECILDALNALRTVEPFRALVSHINLHDRRVIINVGKFHGIHIGDKFGFYKKPAPRRDEKQYRPEVDPDERIGLGEVISVSTVTSVLSVHFELNLKAKNLLVQAIGADPFANAR